jgi:hypothetical protein
MHNPDLDTHAASSHAECNGNSDIQRDSDRHDYAERYTNGHPNSYSYAYGKADPHYTAQRDAEATSHPGTAP